MQLNKNQQILWNQINEKRMFKNKKTLSLRSGIPNHSIVKAMLGRSRFRPVALNQGGER